MRISLKLSPDEIRPIEKFIIDQICPSYKQRRILYFIVPKKEMPTVDLLRIQLILEDKFSMPEGGMMSTCNIFGTDNVLVTWKL